MKWAMEINDMFVSHSRKRLPIIATAAIFVVFAFAAPTAAATTTPTTVPTISPASAAAAADSPDWTKLGFQSTLAARDITPGSAATIKAGPFSIDVPADTFTNTVKFQVLTGDLARFIDKAPSGEAPILDFAFNVLDTKTNQLVEDFNKPVTLTATDPGIAADSMYYDLGPDGTYGQNPTGMKVSGGQLIHPVGSAGVAWVITTPLPTGVTGKIALLLPETKTPRYEASDKPYFEDELTKLCPGCDVIYGNANQDANLELSQAEAALANGARVLVLDPVDSDTAAAIVDKANAQGVPVIAYDRVILNTASLNYYISYDSAKVGQLQAQSLANELNSMGKATPTIVMIGGSPTDNNAALFKQGAHAVFDPLVKAGKLTIAKEYDTPDSNPDQAQAEMQQALTALGDKVNGVYAADDGIAGGAIAAMKAAGLSPLPPVTGQGADLSAVQRILLDEQYMTVYNAYKPEAQAAAMIAFDLLAKNAIPTAMTSGQTAANGKSDVPSVLLTPVAVTKGNIDQTIVREGFWTVQQICTTDYAAACTAAGLQ
jgi:D-xylose transport system substrate-binding protein